MNWKLSEKENSMEGMEYEQIALQMLRSEVEYRGSEIRTYEAFAESAKASFLERLQVKLDASESIRNAAYASGAASALTLILARAFGEWREVQDPCTDRTFILIDFLGTTYLQEEIK